MSQSLAQYVASIGGIRSSDPALQGELDRVRWLNTKLRGRNSLFRPDGAVFDVAAIAAIDAGYPIHESNFLEALEADALAWAEARDTDRVWIDYELSAADLDVFDADFESFLMERVETLPCAVCGLMRANLEHYHGEDLCSDCHRWAEALTGEPEGFELVPQWVITDTEAGYALAQSILDWRESW